MTKWGISIKQKVIFISSIALSILVVFSIIFVIVFGNNQSIRLTIYDNTGKILTTATSIEDYQTEENAAYLDVVLNESVEALATKYSLTTKEAKEKLEEEMT